MGVQTGWARSGYVPAYPPLPRVRISDFWKTGDLLGSFCSQHASYYSHSDRENRMFADLSSSSARINASHFSIILTTMTGFEVSLVSNESRVGRKRKKGET